MDTKTDPRTPTVRRRLGGGLAALLVATAAAGLAAFGTPHATSTRLPHVVLTGSRPIDPVAAATRSATAELDTLEHASGWALSSTPPAGFSTWLKEQTPFVATTDFVDVVRYVALSGTPTAALRRAAKSLGLALPFQGSAFGPTGSDDFERFYLPAAAGLPYRWLDVAASAVTGGRTDGRFDAVVTYDPAKPPYERVPAGVDRASLAVTTATGPARTFEITAPKQVSRLVDAVDAMQRTPDYVGPLPATGGSDAREQFVVSFFERGTTDPVAVIVEAPLLLSVGFTLGQRALPMLTDAGTPGLRGLVESLTGVRFSGH